MRQARQYGPVRAGVHSKEDRCSAHCCLSETRLPARFSKIWRKLRGSSTFKKRSTPFHKLRNGIQENLVTFLPAKAGSGCTTVALNTAGRLAGDLGHKVLLIECDLNSGVLSMILDVKAPRSLLDALENSSHLDYSLWS